MEQLTLEQAAIDYTSINLWSGTGREMNEAFKAGAEWMKAQLTDLFDHGWTATDWLASLGQSDLAKALRQELKKITPSDAE